MNDVYGVDAEGWATQRHGHSTYHGLCWWGGDGEVSWHAEAYIYADLSGPPLHAWSFDALEFA